MNTTHAFSDFPCAVEANISNGRVRTTIIQIRRTQRSFLWLSAYTVVLRSMNVLQKARGGIHDCAYAVHKMACKI